MERREDLVVFLRWSEAVDIFGEPRALTMDEMVEMVVAIDYFRYGQHDKQRTVRDMCANLYDMVAQKMPFQQISGICWNASHGSFYEAISGFGYDHLFVFIQKFMEPDS